MFIISTIASQCRTLRQKAPSLYTLSFSFRRVSFYLTNYARAVGSLSCVIGHVAISLGAATRRRLAHRLAHRLAVLRHRPARRPAHRLARRLARRLADGASRPSLAPQYNPSNSPSCFASTYDCASRSRTVCPPTPASLAPPECCEHRAAPCRLDPASAPSPAPQRALRCSLPSRAPSSASNLQPHRCCRACAPPSPFVARSARPSGTFRAASPPCAPRTPSSSAARRRALS